MQDQGSEGFRAPERSGMPEILSHLTIGFNSCTRHLEAMAQACNPIAIAARGSALDNESTGKKHLAQDTPSNNSSAVPKPLAVVFVPRSDQPSIMNSHLPTLVATASLVVPAAPAIRLVNLPKGAEKRLCTALRLTRITFIGLLEGAPNAAPLIDFVREHISAVEVPWVEEAVIGTFHPVNVKAA